MSLMDTSAYEKEQLLANTDDGMSTADTASIKDHDDYADEESKLLNEVKTPVTLTWDKVTVKPPPPKKSLFGRKPKQPVDPRPILSRSKWIFITIKQTWNRI